MLWGTKSPIELARILLDLGFNVVSYDQRIQEKYGDYNTFRALESMSTLRHGGFETRQGGQQSNALGQSCGRSTAAIALGRTKPIDYLVLDCPVSDDLK